MTNTIGETLRRERVRQNLSLQQLSETTKIGTRMLQAMETGDLQKLPGGVFTRSFLKQYAGALGIDAAFIESELRNSEHDSEEKHLEKQSPSFSFPALSDALPGLQSIVWIGMALLVCAGVYYVMNRGGIGLHSSQATAAKSSVVTQRADVPKPAEPQQSAPAPPPIAVKAQPLGSGPLQVVLNASEESWVSVSVDGKQVFSGVLHSNEKKEISAEERVKVVAGNAGGLDIFLNGKSVDSLGPKGQVRTVELTRAGAQVVSRTPKPAPLL